MKVLAVNSSARKAECVMKRRISIILSVLIAVVLTACGNYDVSERQEKTPDSEIIIPEEQSEETQSEEPQSVSEGEQETDVYANTDEDTDADTKVLVVYFSCTGTTRPLAEYAAEILEADIYEIVAEDPYTETDLAYYTNGRADREQNDPNVRPAISGNVENMEQYEIIVIGYPIWHGQAPRIISTFLESYDFSGKTIVPFCTSHSSGLGSSADNLHALCPDSTRWGQGRRFEAGTSKDAIEEWLESEGIK